MNAPKPFRFSLNTSTIRGQKLSLVEEIEIAAKAGYDAIEPWMSEIDAHEKNGGSLDDLRKRLLGSGLTVENAIGFFEWIVDDPARRKAGFEQARRDMDKLAKIGGKRIAAPPWGAHDKNKREAPIALAAAAERYAALLDLGREFGVVPQLELWGFSYTLSRIGEVAYVAAETGRTDAGILADVYHIHKGGSPLSGLGLLNGEHLHIFHVNDYPASPPAETINDSDRVFPGDGVAPLADVFAILRRIGFSGVLSLELFNADYYKMDPLTAAKTGLEKTKAAAV